MAYEIRKINPLDIDPNTGVGVGLNFQSPGVFTTTYTTTQATKNNLVNYLLTGQGERFLNPTFGFSLQSYIFEQLNNNTADSIEQDIQTSIQELFPTVRINSLTVTQNPDTYQVSIKLNYSIAEETDTIDITVG